MKGDIREEAFELACNNSDIIKASISYARHLQKTNDEPEERVQELAAAFLDGFRYTNRRG